MQREIRSEGPLRRRAVLAASGGAIAGLLAGCLGDDEGADATDGGGGDTANDGGIGGSGDTTPATLAEASPMGSAVDGTALSWDDLGDLEGTITIYCGRTRDQIEPVFLALEDEYPDLNLAIDWNDNDSMVSQLMQEGDNTPADLVYSQDPGALGALYDDDLLQELPSDIVDAVPESFREPGGHWTGVTGRVRAIQYNTDRLDETDFDSWDELPTDIQEYATDERLAGIISTRPNSGTFRGFIQAMVELEGEETTREWVRAMVEDQDVQRFSGGSDQAEAVNRGGDDDPIVALGNSYYAARILNEDPDAPIRVTFTENDPGCLFSVAGVAGTNNIDDPVIVAEFVRHLLAEEGQAFMMDANGEYPVVEGIEYVGPLPDLEDIDPPAFDLSTFDMELQEAQDLLVDEGMMPL